MNYVFKTTFIFHLVIAFCSFEQLSQAGSVRLYGSEGLLAVKSEALSHLLGARFLDETLDIEAQKADLAAQSATAICLSRGYGGGVDRASLFAIDEEGKQRLLLKEVASDHIGEFNEARSEILEGPVGIETVYSLHYPIYSRRRVCKYVTAQCKDLILPVVIFTMGGQIVRLIMGAISRGYPFHLPLHLNSSEFGYLVVALPALLPYPIARCRRRNKETKTGKYQGSSTIEVRVLREEMPQAPHLVFSRDFHCFESGWRDSIAKKQQNTDLNVNMAIAALVDDYLRDPEEIMDSKFVVKTMLNFLSPPKLEPAEFRIELPDFQVDEQASNSEEDGDVVLQSIDL